MLRAMRLYAPNNDGGEGGGGNDSKNNGGGNEPTGADAKAAAEVIKWRERFGDLKTEKEGLEAQIAKLEGEMAKITRQNEKMGAELGVYKSTEARKAAVKKALESADVKGKLSVDEEKVMKFLSRGTFDEAKLDADVREAIEFVGVPITRGSGVSERGVSGDGGTSSDRTSTKNNDPLGSFVTSTFGGR